LAELYFDKSYRITQLLDSTDPGYKTSHFYKKSEFESFNPDYALENLLQLESAAKYTVTLHF